MLANSSTSPIDQFEKGTEGVYVFPPSWHGLKQQVIYVAQFGGGIQVVEGVAGAGKSTFALWLSDDQDVLPMSMMSMLPTTEPQNLFFELLLQLGLRPSPSAGAGKLLVMLRSYVQSLHREGSRVVMLIDDAHWIADSDLAALISTMQDASEAGLGLHLILMSEPGLARRIDDLQLLDLAVHDGVLPPLSASEVATLISRRQAISAIDDYSPEHAQKVWSQSKGIPGKVLALLSHRAEIIRAEEVVPRKVPQKSSTGSFRGWPVAHLVALIFLCGILAWAYLVQRSEPDPHIRAVNVGLPVGEALESSSIRERGIIHSQPNTPTDMEAVATGESAVGQSTNARVAVAIPIPQESIGSHVTDAGAELNTAAAGAEESLIEPDEPAEKQVESNAAPMGVEVAKVNPLPEPVKSVRAATQPAGDAPAKPIKSVQNVASAVVPSKDLVSQSEARLLGLPSSAYILQLMASSETNKLIAFLEAQPNRKNLMVYRTFRDGKVFHILVEGYYADKAAASAAAANLPLSQKKAGPWPKRIEFVQKEIAEYRKK